MNLNFDDLADIVINEAPISDYINKARRKMLKSRIMARKAGRLMIDDPETAAKKAVFGTVKGVGKAAGKVGSAVGSAAKSVASGAKEFALNAPGMAAKAVTAVPNAVKTARNLFLGDSPGQTVASGLNKLQGWIDKKREDSTAKSLGLRTQNPKTGENVSIEIGRNPAAGVGIKIPVTGNVGTRFGKTSKFQNQTIYDIPITNNRNIGLVKVGIGDPKDPNVSLYFFDKNNQRIDGRTYGLPNTAVLNYSNKVNGWKITDKEPPGIEEFSLSKVKVAMQKTQAQQKAAGATVTPTSPKAPGAPVTGTVSAPGAVTGGTATPVSAAGTAATATTAPTSIIPTPPSTTPVKTTSSTMPKQGEVFNIEDRFGKLKKYQISAIDGDTVYAFQV